MYKERDSITSSHEINLDGLTCSKNHSFSPSHNGSRNNGNVGALPTSQ